ncbi:hypothetical protein CGC21_37355 [Leishmania donovani]|uniref:Uncharacterized protein n=1 Tax=Leishmania donovani TaxID=5661 RepID=A0A504Y5N5_LEIDO|nr:hypothetical protein CGC21_37355 [Leishmania donovani]
MTALDAAADDAAPSLENVAAAGATLWPTETFLHFSSFRDAYSAWHEHGDFFRWLQSSDYAVALLAASNLHPLHFTVRAPATTPTAHSPNAAETPAVHLVLCAPCCNTTVVLSEEERLALAKLARILPFHVGPSGVATPNEHSTAILAHATQLERQHRITAGLLARAHREGCAWRDRHTTGEQGVATDEATVSCARQLLLGSPSLSIMESATVRAFCAAVILRPPDAEAATSTAARTRCLLPRGTPPSVVRQCMEDTLAVLDPASSGVNCAAGAVVPRLRYTGSNVNDRILQLFFAPKKRPRPEPSSGAACSETGVNGEVVLQYMALLMILYGYTVAATGDVQSVEAENSDGDAADLEHAECAARAGTFRPSRWGALPWKSPPTILSSADEEEGNRRVHKETSTQSEMVSFADAMMLLGWHVRCQFCAHSPAVVAVREIVTTATTTTIATTGTAEALDTAACAFGRSTADVSRDETQSFVDEDVDLRQPQQRAGASGGSSSGDGVGGGNEDVLDALAEVEAAILSANRSRHSGEVKDEAAVVAAALVNGSADQSDGAKDGDDKLEACAYSQGYGEEDAAVSATPSSSASRGSRDGRSEEEVRVSLGLGSDIACNEEMPIEEDSEEALGEQSTHMRSGVALSPVEATTLLGTADAGAAAEAFAFPSTTVTTKTVTKIETRGHHGNCPWHRLFLTDAIDATALAAPERFMDFTWVVGEDGDTLHEERVADRSNAAPTYAATSEDRAQCGTHETARGVDADGEELLAPPQDPLQSEGESDVCEASEKNSNRTLLVLRFLLPEVERLITTWRLSEEWERTRPDEYLRHPLWRTWLTSQTLHPVHTENADGMMEQYLRVLERRLMPLQSTAEETGAPEKSPAAAAGGKGNDSSVKNKAAAKTMEAAKWEALGTLEELGATIGAPLYSVNASSFNRTVESALHLATRSLHRCFAGDQAAAAAGGRANSADARALLREGLRSVLRASGPSAAQSVAGSSGAELKVAFSAADNEESRGKEAAEAARAFLKTMEARYADDVVREGSCSASRLRLALQREAIPHGLHEFTTFIYPTLQRQAGDCSISVADPVYVVNTASGSTNAAPSHTPSDVDRCRVMQCKGGGGKLRPSSHYYTFRTGGSRSGYTDDQGTSMVPAPDSTPTSSSSAVFQGVVHHSGGPPMQQVRYDNPLWGSPQPFSHGTSGVSPPLQPTPVHHLTHGMADNSAVPPIPASFKAQRGDSRLFIPSVDSSFFPPPSVAPAGGQEPIFRDSGIGGEALTGSGFVSDGGPLFSALHPFGWLPFPSGPSGGDDTAVLETSVYAHPSAGAPPRGRAGGPPPRSGDSVWGSLNTSNLSSGSGGPAEDVRLSNWSSSSISQGPATGDGGGGAVLGPITSSVLLQDSTGGGSRNVGGSSAPSVLGTSAPSSFTGPKAPTSGTQPLPASRGGATNRGQLQREVEALQQLRRSLHDAYIVEDKAGHRPVKNVRKPLQPIDMRRTVDAPTLSVLKSPNYPFTLCEEAPPSYVPPPVPYDVEGEIDSLKQRVLQVQEDFQSYQKRHSRGGTPLSASQVLDFFSQNKAYAEIAWEVSSMQWFYRWVLSHSISHLWNCKEQLEYVLTDHGESLPQTVEEMDACLQAYPFAAAVSILDSDRQAVVAQERRRLRSVSRIFRENVPSIAVTAATSCYLTPEEKYMYQEFFNQSEHMILLLNHTLLLNEANSASASALQSHTESASRGLLFNSQSRAHGYLQDSDALSLPSEPTIGVMDTASLTKETLNAVAAEQEMIAALMKAIRERQQRGECFEVSAAEGERTRAAQVAVYGCVLSDMSLMAHQMNLTVEFMEHYESWLKLHGYDSHDQLMNALSKRSGGTAWPTLSIYGEYGAADGHDHFVPPTESMMRYYRLREKAPREAVDAKGKNPSSETCKPVGRSMAPSGGDSGGTSMPISAWQETDSEVANAFYALLIHANEAVRKSRAAVAEKDDAVERTWLTACMRYAVIKMLRRDWCAADVAKGMLTSEEALLAVVGRKGAFSCMKSTAAALCVVVKEVARLCAARSSPPSLVAEVPVAVHIPDDVDNYAKVVTDVTNPVEQQRWGSLVDAVWFQADPSSASCGGLLFHPMSADGELTGPIPCNKQSALHFLYIEAICMPPTAVASGVVSVALRYRIPRMSPAADTSRRVAPTLAAVSDAQPSSRGGLSRYHLARRVLMALFEIEAKGLLPCFACRVSEVSVVPLVQMVYVAFDDGNTSSVVDKGHVPHLCMLPPAAMELKRMDIRVGAAPAPKHLTDALYAAYAEPVNFSSIGLLVGGALEDMASRAPTLHDLYMTAATVLEQATFDVKSGATPKAFANASTHPTPIACAPAKTRAMSIQREPVINRNSTSIGRFISPLLRHIDDRISSWEFGDGISSVGGVSNNASTNTQSSVWTQRDAAAPEPASLTGRQTELVGRIDTASPSPSAVRPNRR